jgi:chaperone BCS1
MGLELLILAISMPVTALISHLPASWHHVGLTPYLSVLLMLGVITAVVGRCLPSIASVLWNRCFTIAEIQPDDELYDCVSQWVSQRGLAKRANRLTVATREDWITDDETEDDTSETREAAKLTASSDHMRSAVKRIQYSLGPGTYLFRYHGHWFSFTSLREGKSDLCRINYKERILLCGLRWHSSTLKELLVETQRSFAEKHHNKIGVYHPRRSVPGVDNFVWVRSSPLPFPALESLILGDDKGALIEDITTYLQPQTRSWCHRRGFPYHRGYLFLGPPGTGKTIFSFALAGFFGLRLYVVNLNTRTMTDDGLTSLLHHLPRQCVVLLDHVDAIDYDMHHRVDVELPGTPSNATPGISESGLWNVLDEIAWDGGHIFIMTANDHFGLGEGWLRPGRVDTVWHFPYADQSMVQRIFQFIYKDYTDGLQPSIQTESIKEEDTELNSDQKLSVSPVAEFSVQFAKSIPERLFSPAQIRHYLFLYRTDPKAAIKNAEHWVRKRQQSN